MKDRTENVKIIYLLLIIKLLNNNNLLLYLYFKMKANNSFSLMIVPGNNCSNITKGNWYYWLSLELTKHFPDADIICKTMPDPHAAREEFWIPFIKESFQNSKQQTLYVVGHSSGAVAIMRLLETFNVKGSVIVSGCVTDLGDDNERKSGYYPTQPNGDNRPWEWSKMKSNSGWIMQFAGEDDQFIPIDEMREIRDQLGLSKDFYFEFNKVKGKGHFMQKEFPELLEALVKQINNDFKV